MVQPVVGVDRPIEPLDDLVGLELVEDAADDLSHAAGEARHRLMDGVHRQAEFLDERPGGGEAQAGGGDAPAGFAPGHQHEVVLHEERSGHDGLGIGIRGRNAVKVPLMIGGEMGAQKVEKFGLRHA